MGAFCHPSLIKLKKCFILLFCFYPHESPKKVKNDVD